MNVATTLAKEQHESMSYGFLCVTN